MIDPALGRSWMGVSAYVVPGFIARHEEGTVTALADVATISLLQERAAHDSRILIDQLQGAFQSRVVIEQAKGIISQHRGIDMGEAFALLRSFARNNNQQLTEVSRLVVAGSLDPRQLSRA